VKSLAQAAEERGQTPEQIIRSLLFRVAEGEFVLVLMAGPSQVDWKALRHYLGQSRLTTASRDEVETVTGYKIGAVAPFGLPQPLRVLVDEGVLGGRADSDEVSIGSGERGTTVIMTTAALRTALQAVGATEVGQFGQAG
jgi:prolyl-tRNA editing enzyme YbaK/EbsC (Cys-tRNA(Pro) deacylase)